MRGRHKAGLFGNIRDALVGFLDQILRGLDAHTVDVLDQAEVDGLFKEAAEIVGADIELAGNAGQGQLLRVMLGDIGLDLVNDVVADTAAVAALLLLLAAELLQLKQQRCHQHLAHGIGLGRGFLLQGKKLLQYAVDVVLLLDRDDREQVVMLLTQEREEVHLRENVGDLVEILTAEVGYDTAGRTIPQRGGLVDLVFTDQHHTARIDDVGGILDKIAAASLDLIVDLILMVDMEAGHLVAGITVDPVDEKVHMGRVDIFQNHTAAPDCRGALHPAFGSCSISKDSTIFAVFQTIFIQNFNHLGVHS